MKKILTFAMAVVMCGGLLFAQKDQPIAEKDVKVSYVKDFQKQVKEATNVAWWALENETFKVTYQDSEKSRQAMVFSSKGTETHYYIDKQYYPAAVRDTVSHLYPDYSITDVWVRKIRGKMTYQARIAKKSGFLWWKKERDAQVINFEVDGKYIGA